MRKKICNLIIVDASGSMQSKQEAVVSGLKDLFNQIKSNDEVRQHTIVCDFSGADDFRVLVNGKKKLLTDVIANAYRTRGNTALYDAIGNAFALVPAGMDGVFVNIITDGEENASRVFKKNEIKLLIENANLKKWGVTFMGTTEQAIMDAKDMGIAMSNMYSFADNSKGIKLSASARGTSMSNYHNSVSTSLTSADINNINLMDGVDTNAIFTANGSNTITVGPDATVTPT